MQRGMLVVVLIVVLLAGFFNTPRASQHAPISCRASVPIVTQRGKVCLSRIAPIEWTRSNTLAFIDPCLWNVKCKEYKRRDLRSASLEVIKAEMSRIINCEVDSVDIMKKKHTLDTIPQRTVFTEVIHEVWGRH